MNKENKKNISPTEWRLMKILWSRGAAAARDVHEIAEKRYGMTIGTTKNLLSRLVAKGHVVTERVGNSFLYKPVSPMLNSVCDAADELLEHTSEEVFDALMVKMVKRGKLSGKGIQKLRALLDEYEE